MGKKLHFKLSVVLGLILLIFISCMSDVDLSNISKNIKIDQSIGIPVGEANMTIKDLLTKFNLPSNIDTLSDEIFYHSSISGDYEFHPFNLADSLKPYSKTIAPFNSTFTVPTNGSIPDIQVADYLGLGVNTNIGEQRIDLVKIKSSSLNVEVNVSPDLENSGIPASALTVEFSFLNNKLIFDNGVVTQTFTPNAYRQNTQMNLGGCTINAAGATTIPFTIIIHFKPQNFPITFTSASKIYLNLHFTDIVLDKAYGLFKMKDGGSKTVTLPFDLGNYLPNAFLKFDNPTVDIKVSTNIGADFAFNLDYLNLYNSSNPTKTYSAWFNNHTSNSQSMYLSGPTVLGQWTKDSTQLNNTNGETNQLFDSKPYPNTIDFKYSILNADLPTRIQNFVSADSKINFTVDMRMKMGFLGGSNYVGIDTIKNVNQTLGSILDGIDSAVLVLRFANEIPVKAFYRMTFWKSNADNDTIISTVTNIKNDSTTRNIFSQFIINAPQINADGSVKAGVVNSQTILIGVNKQTIEDLKKTSFIIFKLQLASKIVNGVANPVHFTTKNSFGVKLGVLLKPNTTVNIEKTN